MFAIITHHTSHTAGRWQHDGAVWDTKELAIEAARAAWDATPGVTWRLMSIPIDDDDDGRVCDIGPGRREG